MSAKGRLLRLRLLDGKADLEDDLVVADLALLDMAARLDHLEPPEVLQRLRGTRDGVLDRILDARLGGARKLDDSVDLVLHRTPPLMRGAVPPAPSRCRGRGRREGGVEKVWRPA